jgi:pyruvate/2-oxoglutarate dehydrogenase complex dihydrolipoamide dehydrogenase (E3) component
VAGAHQISCDVAVIGSGPAGIVAALRAADLGARTVLVSRGAFGGMAANDGPVPVRTLAHAARLLRDARQLGRYGIAAGAPAFDYAALLARVGEVVGEVRARSSFRPQLDALGVTILEHAGAARFVGSHALTTRDAGLQARKVIICTGGKSRQLPVPGFELTVTHSDAFALTSVPESMIVLGAGATGVQVASIFHAFGTRVNLFQAGPRILPAEDEDVSRAVAGALRESGVEIHVDFGAVGRFERAPGGVRMTYGRNGDLRSAEARLAVAAVGWVADTSELAPDVAGVALDERGFLKVNAQLRTSAGHVFAAGDGIGRMMLVPQAIESGFIAATNAVQGTSHSVPAQAAPTGSFTDPEYAQVGLTEAQAREKHRVIIAVIPFDTTTRTIIDGHTYGFCKLVADAESRLVLGCHIVGERAVEIAQLAALAMAGAMTVDSLARVPLSYPTYGAVLARVAAKAAHELNGRGAAGDYQPS